MATPKKPRSRAPTRRGAEYRFKIDAYTPDTMPMARLAAYLEQLSALLGEPPAVHFKRLDAGSTVVVHRIDREAVPKVLDRASAVRTGNAPPEAMRAYRAVNKLLREDNAIGVLQDKKTGAIIIPFPGRDAVDERYAAIKEPGTIDGRLERVGGSDATIHVTLEVDGQTLSRFVTDRVVGKALGHHLFEQVRLIGKGSWSRDDDGTWTLHTFRIDGFEPLNEAPLSEALASIRAVSAEWDADAYDNLQAIRHGPRKTNGGD